MPALTDTATERSLGSVSTSRVEAFSDGVFAIATTLLILGITIPKVGETGDLFSALFALWPSYVSYLVSFLTIGVMWLNHHFLVGMFARVDRTLLMLNLCLLAVIAFVPFPTGVLAEYMVAGTPQQLFVAAALYGSTMLLVTSIFVLLWLHVRRATVVLKNAALSRPIATRAVVFAGFSTVAYLIAIGIGAFAPAVSLILFAAVAVLFAFGRLTR